jgi:hypothetical protein
MNMRFLFFAIFAVLLTGSISAQSKKEQIASLTYKVDSLNAVIKSVTNSAQSKERSLNFTIDSIAKRWSATKNELTRISKDFNTTKEEFSSLDVLKNRLEIELIALKEENAKLKLDALNKNRFEDIDKKRVLSINNKPLVLYPFEIFEIMTFVGVETGSLNASLEFFVTETGHKFSFLDNNNNIEMDELDFEEDLKTGSWVMKGQVAHILLEHDDGVIRRSLVKNRGYKVIYCFKSDSELWRKPFPTESSDGYYIVDVLELNQPFEREKEEGN